MTDKQFQIRGTNPTPFDHKSDTLPKDHPPINDYIEKKFYLKQAQILLKLIFLT